MRCEWREGGKEGGSEESSFSRNTHAITLRSLHTESVFVPSAFFFVRFFVFLFSAPKFGKGVKSHHALRMILFSVSLTEI